VQKVCDDGNECTDSFCEAGSGICQHFQVEDGRSCNAGEGMCQTGVCRAVLGEPCTTVEECYQDGLTICEETCCRPNFSECIDNAWCCSGLCDNFVCR
jgi:hypothetical protein